LPPFGLVLGLDAALTTPAGYDQGSPPLEKPGLLQRALLGRGDDGRDVSKPVGADEHGRPLYAPRGILCRIPWP